MTTESIKVYCRVRPVFGVASLVEYEVNNDSAEKKSGSIELFVPEDLNLKNTTNKAPAYKFVYNQVFDQDTNQATIYEQVAKPVIDNAFRGYNGTVFVYGQTATGKTYTVLGEDAANQVSSDQIKKQIRRKMKQKRAFKKRLSRVSPRENQISTGNSSSLNDEQSQNFVKPNENAQIVDPNQVQPSETVRRESLSAIPETQSTADRPQVSESPSLESSLPQSEGILPRTLLFIFSSLSSYDADSKVEVSYYEIYKEQGYDLLSGYTENRRAYDLKHLNPIKAMTDKRHRLHLRNLSLHRVRDSSEALDLLLHGNENRHVAETHLNEASSRSHCIFTIYLTIKHPETASILQPKLHLVDLAGSERFGKSHETSEKVMNEGRNINLSLHHLQRVIVALTKRNAAQQQRKHVHVPFRNSTMTLVLKDSLGGNCYTSMIATISVEERNLEESISTCRFAQEVSTITNRLIINEIEDSDLIIARLKEEVEEMK